MHGWLPSSRERGVGAPRSIAGEAEGAFVQSFVELDDDEAELDDVDELLDDESLDDESLDELDDEADSLDEPDELEELDDELPDEPLPRLSFL